MEMVRRCCTGVELLEEMLEKGSGMLVSDIGCGALLCKAAMESAAMNVFINTGSLKDRDGPGAWKQRSIPCWRSMGRGPQQWRKQ